MRDPATDAKEDGISKHGKTLPRVITLGGDHTIVSVAPELSYAEYVIKLTTSTMIDTAAAEIHEPGVRSNHRYVFESIYDFCVTIS